MRKRDFTPLPIHHGFTLDEDSVPRGSRFSTRARAAPTCDLLMMKRLLSGHPEIEIVGEANTGDQALDLIPRLTPDVIFLDVQMPGMSSFDLLEHLDDVAQVIFYHGPR